jgi:hypothetical protein
VTWQHLDPVGLVTTINVPALQASNRISEVSTTVLRSAGQQVRLRLDVAPGERFFGLGERMGPLALNGSLPRRAKFPWCDRWVVTCMRVLGGPG